MGTLITSVFGPAVGGFGSTSVGRPGVNISARADRLGRRSSHSLLGSANVVLRPGTPDVGDLAPASDSSSDGEPLGTISSPSMRAVADIEKEILELNDEQRARLAVSILDSLPGVLADQDEGVAEALRRDAELDVDPESALSLERLDDMIRDRRS